MSNILESPDDWQGTGWSYTDGIWQLPFKDMYGGNTYLEKFDIQAGSTIQARMRYDFYNVPSSAPDIYFLVYFGYDSPDNYFFQVFFTGGGTTSSGELNLDLSIFEDHDSVWIGYTRDPYSPPSDGVIDEYVQGEIKLTVSGGSGPPDPPGPPGPPTPPSGSVNQSQPAMVYEFEKGWGFAGRYIPHYAEMNWWFGDSPVANTAVQKLRIHGLAKGQSLLSVAVSNMCEPTLSYDRDFTEPQWVDLPRELVRPNKEFKPVTNYTDTASRGVATQFRFEGRNEDPSATEPPHVIQVTVVQGTADGATIN